VPRLVVGIIQCNVYDVQSRLRLVERGRLDSKGVKEKKIEGVRHVGRLPEVRIALAILV
jgi:hypothetical protein